MSHCHSCICDGGTVLSELNARIRCLMKNGQISLGKVSKALQGRLTDSKQYQFGFRDFIPDYGTTRVAAVFLCALKDPYEYFACSVPAPYTSNPIPFQYDKGQAFDVSDAPYMESFLELNKLTDDELVMWVGQSLHALHAYVEAHISKKYVDGAF